jgi:hypothetical protein
MIVDIYVYSEPVRNAHFYMTHIMYYSQLVGYYIQPIFYVVPSMLIYNIGKVGNSFMVAWRAEPVVPVSNVVMFKGF